MAENKTIDNNNPVVSVIIPLYNVEDYLEKCLDSVTNQTLSDIEIICIDDGSTDGSPDILKEYAEKDERIVVIKKEHSNAGDARNEGLRIARGKYLAFVDADDFTETDMVEKAYRAAEEQSADIVWFRCRLYDHFSKKYIDCPWTLREHEMPEGRPFSSLEASEKIFNMGSTTPWDKLFRKDFILENDLKFQSITTSNDMVFTFGALSLAERITTIGDVLYYQRVNHLKKLATNVTDNFLNYYKALVGLKEFMTERGFFDFFEKSFKNWAVDFSLWTYNSYREPFHQVIGQRLRNEHFFDLEINKMSRADFYNQEQFDQVKELFKRYKAEKECEKNNRSLVSVIVPVHNASDNLVRCMDGLLAQTLKDIEIICIDDGSEDRSGEILSGYANKDSRFRVIKNETFKGHGYAVNQGIRAACADYISIVEVPDLIDERMLEVLYNRAVEHDLELVVSDICKLKYDRYGSAEVVSMMSGHFHDDCERVIDFRYERVWKDYYKVPLGLLIKKALISYNDIVFKNDTDESVVDEDFVLKMYTVTEKGMCIHDILYYDIMKSALFSGYARMELLV